MNIIYCRTAQASEEGVKNQQQICVDFLKSKKINPDTIFIDNGFSGLTDERPELQDMLLKLDNIESITVKSIERLYMDSEKLFDFYNTLKNKSIKLFDATLGIDIIGTYDKRMIDIIRSLSD